MTRSKMTRRDALRAGAATVAVPSLIPTSALSAPGRPGPNDQVAVAIIGSGGRSRAITRSSQGVPELRITAVCDCFEPAVSSYVKQFKDVYSPKPYLELAEMLDREKLDGAMVETTTHARAWCTIHAMAAGLDVYIEKPMCLTIAEGRAMVDAARKAKRVTQVGTQQRSIPLNNWASDLVKNGAIGQIKTVLAPNFVGPLRWNSDEKQPLPAGGSDGWWDVWTNQAEFRPYHARLHHGWDTWWAYDGGGRCYGVTGWGTHSYDQIQRALGTDETGPVEVLLEEPVSDQGCGKFDNVVEQDATHLDYLKRLAKPVSGPRAKMRMKYADGTELRLHLDGDWGPGLGAIFVGTEGKIEINRDKVAANPKELLQRDDNPGQLKKNENVDHIQNWVDCIKSRERCHADIEYGQRSSTLCYLVNIARDVGQVGQPLRWDPAAERFTNCDEGNKLVDRPRRKGWELPTV